MDGHKNNTVEPMDLNNSILKNDGNDENRTSEVALEEEANSLANSLNKRLKRLSNGDAEVFMSNFEKNVLLLPKNTKKGTVSGNNYCVIPCVTQKSEKDAPEKILLLPENANTVTIPSSSDESAHDFVLLDSEDMVSSNFHNFQSSDGGFTLFGASKKPSPQISFPEQQTCYSTANPFAFLDDFLKSNVQSQDDNLVSDRKSSPSTESFNETQKEPLKCCNFLSNENRFPESSYKHSTSSWNTITAKEPSPSSKYNYSKMHYGNEITTTSFSAKDVVGGNDSRTDGRHEYKRKTVFATSKENDKSSYVCQKTDEMKSKTYLKNESAVASFVKPDPKTYSSSNISRPVSLTAVQTHVANVTEQSNEWLQGQSTGIQRKSGNRKAINILVLGQTGVGKSTWINAFANYLTYSTLEEAIAAEAPVCVIPTKFSLFDDKYQRHEVLLGNHSNEVFSDKGQSATQNAKTYLFEKNEYDIYIIDTPGMDDTRGPHQDNENVQKILRAVAPFKELHAICFLFKANEARLTQSFKYCISKLLGNLSKSALNNTCFVFTNARGTFYKPGDTMGPLKAYFQELQQKENLYVAINDANTFCLDNEAFRFICAYFSKFKFGDHEIKTYSDSWKHSANEIIRLLNHAARIRPHSTSETLSINETRTWILQLVNPIIDVSSVIQTNLCKLEEQIDDLKRTDNNIQDLQKRVAIPITALELIKMKYPQTVCASEKCITYETIEGNLQPIYKTACHKPCYVKYDDSTEKEDRYLSYCEAFIFDSCIKCKCNVKDHKRIFYEQKIITKNLETQTLKNALASEVDASKIKKRMIRDCQKMTDGYKKELDYVLLGMANFSTFLSQNAVTQRADIFEKHLEKMIKSEESMFRFVKNSSDKKFYRLVNLLSSYQDIRQQLNKISTPLSLEEIQDIRQKLFSMPLTGSKIAEIFDVHVQAESNDHVGNITRCEPKSFIRQYAGYATAWATNKVSSFFGRQQK